MTDQQGGEARVTNLTPEDVARGLTEGRMLLVDVREPNEVAIERYPDAVVLPLSSFDPAAIPDPQGRQVVFACRSGRRSVTASLAAQERGEMEIIRGFLPTQLDDAAVTAAAREAIAATGAASQKDMGKVIGALKQKYAGQMDFAKASAIVKGLLQ